MDVSWLGHSCFRLRGRQATVITDPFRPVEGYTLGRPSANIVTISHHHPDHDNASAVGGTSMVVDGPGEYEIANVLITGIATFHDDSQGASRGKNTVYVIEIDGVTICHLGDLGHLPSSEQVEEMGTVDVLLVPVGGHTTITPKQAAELVSMLDPRLVVPMHYRAVAAKPKLEKLDKFLKEMGLSKAAPEAKLSVSKSSLPSETQLAVLDYKR
jgi:L-ascorbate metabolism protein UlaG (beta-lactamase superfamily)